MAENMSENTAKTFFQKDLTSNVSPISKYHLKISAILASIPFICGMLLLFLLLTFTKLNLFFLEANGLIVDEQVRDAYYIQMQQELINVAWLFLLQVLITFVVGMVTLRWASSPFTKAQKMITRALASDELVPETSILSESRKFDHFVWQFALRVRSNGPNTLEKEKLSLPGMSYSFLLKFMLAYGVLSFMLALTTGIFIGSVYQRVVNMAVYLLQNSKNIAHYFLAQQEIMQDAARMIGLVSFLLYLIIGVRISRYMSTMIYVFCRTLKEDRFPISLRHSDLYHKLAETLNYAHTRISGHEAKKES